MKECIKFQNYFYILLFHMCDQIFHYLVVKCNYALISVVINANAINCSAIPWRTCGCNNILAHVHAQHHDNVCVHRRHTST